MPSTQPLLNRAKVVRVAFRFGGRFGLLPAPTLGLIAGLLMANASAQNRLIFVGDILLSRKVMEERNFRGHSPWRDFDSLFHASTWVMGNLEGTVGDPKECRNTAAGPCFAIPESLLVDLKTAGFTALGLANNHAMDLGPESALRTRRALLHLGLIPMTFAGSPYFASVAGEVIAFVSLSLIPGKDGQAQNLGSLELTQKMRLARNFAGSTVVFIHWGNELQNWPSAQQMEAANGLIDQGADLILGMHPHVIQAPQCLAGKSVFFSLGNHLFDQKYPETKRGLIADCQLQRGAFTCRSQWTQTRPGGFFPRLIASPESLSTLERSVASRNELVCPEATSSDSSFLPLTLNSQWIGDSIVHRWQWRPQDTLLWRGRPARPLSADRAWFPNEPNREFLFNLEKHYSPLDREVSPRPYVYEITKTGLVARWRGSGLAWPLLDATFRSQDSVLCALHRGDSFLIPDSGREVGADAASRRVAAYRWNGFGFSLIRDSTLTSRCKESL